MEERSGACMVLVGKPEGKRPLGRTILTLIFKKWNRGHGLELIWPRMQTGGGLL
jgi:hypothetical protein